MSDHLDNKTTEPAPIMKVQTHNPVLGWMHSTSAGPTLQDAEAVLAGYDRDYPSERHRVVRVTADGAVTVLKEGRRGS